MGDPTGLSGIVVGKLVDWLIEEAKIVINCETYCRALKESLVDIKPLVDSAAKDLSAFDGKTVVEVTKWLENLKEVVEEARELVLKCKTKRLWWMRRYRLSKLILNAQQKIQDIKGVAPLVNLTLNVKIAKGVAQIPDNMRNVVEAVCERQTDTILQTITKNQRVGRSSDQSSSSQQTDQKASPRQIVGNSFGTDAPLEKLQKLLLGESKHNPYVGVCGTGGIGKTRLAELAYNSKDVRDHFTKIFWLTVGKDKSIKGLLRQLAKDLGLGEKISDDLEQDEIKTKVFHALSGEKVLLVLDDIWDKGDPIVKALNVFSGLDTVSKILVTTRDTTILAKNFTKQSTVWMNILSGNDSWELFRENAFQGVDKIPTDVEKLAKDVANRCKGLPLALKVVAAALAGKESPQEWKRALKRLQEAELLDEGNELFNRLQLSYDNLYFNHDYDDPCRLQKCFIYFAAFPEDSDVDSEKLVRLWAGEKMLEDNDDTDDDNDPYIQGNLLLQELIDRSLIELREDKWSEKTNSRRLTCRIHDVLRDFARHLIRKKSAPMDCLFSPGKDYGKFPDKWLKTPCRPGGLSSNATHLSLNSTHSGEQDRIQSFLPDRLYAPTLEVLLLANIKTDNFVIQPGFLESFSSLKVLDLERSLLYSLPESLGNLTNLTYLELSYTTELRKLPRGLCKLTNLEYLGLEGCERMEPFAIECEINYLKNLSTLNTRGCDRVWEAPAELDPMQNLCSLTNLRSLSISSCDREYLPAEMSKLVNLRHLDVKFQRLKGLPLELYFNDGPKLSKLQCLSLSGCTELSEVPSWVGSLSHLAYLDLSFLRKLGSLPNLSKLHHLRKLDLSSCSALTQLGEGFASEGAFLALEELDLQGLTNLKAFPSVQEGVFPKLESLRISECIHLEQLGEGFASTGAFPALKFPRVEVGAFPKLKVLGIQHCEGLEQLGEGFASKGAFPALKELELQYLHKLKEFPPVEVGAFPKLELVRIKNCKGLEQLGEGFASKGAFLALKTLRLGCLEKLKEFPPVEVGAFPKLECLWMVLCEGLEQLGDGFASKGAFPALKELTLAWLKKLKEFPLVEVGAFPKLEDLVIAHCYGLKQLGEGFASKGAFPALKTLRLGWFEKLKEFPPVEVGAFPKLESLDFSFCEGLEQLGEGFASKGAFPALKDLDLVHFEKLKEFPPVEVGAFPKLDSLRIENCEGLEQLGEGFASKGAFPALKTLRLGWLKKLKEFPPVEVGAFPKLELVRIEKCEGLEQLGEGFASKGAFPALKDLDLVHFKKLKEFPPVEVGAFPKLDRLRIENCEGLEQLGEGFASKGAFPALKTLRLGWLKKLKEFPPVEVGAFPKLELLRIEKCEGLEQLGEGFALKGGFPALKEFLVWKREGSES